jgi:cell shape-determining protein MreC
MLYSKKRSLNDMAVVCSKGLIGKTVRLTALGNTSPVMIVTDVDEEGSKKVTVGWLDKNNAFNSAIFPSSSLDKADKEAVKTKQNAATSSAKKKK